VRWQRRRERIARGHLEERVTGHGGDEFASLAVTFNEMAEQLESG